VLSAAYGRVEKGEAAHPTSPSSNRAASIRSSAVLDCSLDRYDAESKRNLTDAVRQGGVSDARLETDLEVIVLATGLRGYGPDLAQKSRSIRGQGRPSLRSGIICAPMLKPIRVRRHARGRLGGPATPAIMMPRGGLAGHRQPRRDRVPVRSVLGHARHQEPAWASFGPPEAGRAGAAAREPVAGGDVRRRDDLEEEDAVDQQRVCGDSPGADRGWPQ
jgi:hypothetical protein